MPEYPTFIQIKTLTSPIGVGEDKKLSVELTYSTEMDIRDVTALILEITYTYSVEVI